MGKESIEQMIEKRRTEMMAIEGEISIQTIYSDIRKLAQELTLEPVVHEVHCKPFFKVGENDFVILLYKQLLQRNPDVDGYMDNLYMLMSGQCTRAEMIEGFANTDEGREKNIKLVGLRKEKIKESIRLKAKKIPGFGYLGRWVSNIVFLSRRMTSMYHSYIRLSAEVGKMKQELETLKQQYDVNHEYCQMLLQRYEAIEHLKEKHELLANQYKEYCQEQADLEKVLKESEQRNKEMCDRFYLHYNERLMPDERDEVKKRALQYIDKLKEWCGNTGRSEKDVKIVDLGCGECEWIELLSENGFSSIGIDSNTAVVAKVKSEFPEIEIVEKDSLEYLRQCEDNSVDCITSFHMVEHMDFLTIISLLKECYRVLKKDGMLIVETPNPQNVLTASYYFYLDPTHIKPIPPELMQFYVEESGFEVYDKSLLNPLNFEPYEYREEDPIKDIVFRFNMEQAYSIMAVKR